MTKENKELLLKDLLGRVLYGVKVDYHGNIFTLGYNLYLNKGDVAFENYPMLYSLDGIESVKPYLRPMSSMTEEERLIYEQRLHDVGRSIDVIDADDVVSHMDWLLERHFDFRGLIPMGLALEAPEDMYKNI